MFKAMKSGHYHSQNFYDINISVKKLLSKVLYSCMKVTETVTLHLVEGKGQSLVNAVVEIGFP